MVATIVLVASVRLFGYDEPREAVTQLVFVGSVGDTRLCFMAATIGVEICWPQRQSNARDTRSMGGICMVLCAHIVVPLRLH